MPVHPPAGLLPCIIHDGSLQISPKYILVKRNSLGNGADSYWSPPAHSFLTRPPIGRHFSHAQPSDCLAIDFPGRAISPGEDLLFPPLRHHTFSLKGVAKLSLRASSEHIPIVRAPRAGGRPGYPLSSLFEQPLHPCLNLIQPLAQVGLKHIGFGLHDHALGLDLILKQHQLGKQLLLL
jgi:hypothetical protein